MSYDNNQHDVIWNKIIYNVVSKVPLTSRNPYFFGLLLAPPLICLVFPLQWSSKKPHFSRIYKGNNRQITDSIISFLNTLFGSCIVQRRTSSFINCILWLHVGRLQRLRVCCFAAFFYAIPLFQARVSGNSFTKCVFLVSAASLLVFITHE